MREIEAISGVFIQAEKVLLVERTKRTNESYTWEVMGGDILPGEQPLDTLMRDAHDKLNIANPTVLATTIISTPGKDVVINRHVYICSGDFTNMKIDQSKYKEAMWCTREEIPVHNLSAHGVKVLHALGYVD